MKLDVSMHRSILEGHLDRVGVEHGGHVVGVELLLGVLVAEAGLAHRAVTYHHDLVRLDRGVSFTRLHYFG